MEELQSLKNKILSLAIQGKLTAQSENDEPASLLLEKIKQEKERLVKEKKIKKDKFESHIYKKDNRWIEKIGDTEKDITNDIPFDIPDSWQWVRLGSVCYVTKLAGFEYTEYFNKDNISNRNLVPIVRAQNVKMGRFIENEDEAISYELSEKLIRSALIKKCLLMTFIGAGIGDVCIFPGIKRNHLAPNVAKIEFYEIKLIEEYVLYALMSFIGQYEIEKIKKSTAQASLSMQTIRQICVPLPPLAEQERIVKKVEEIFKQIEIIQERRQELGNLKLALKNKLLSLAIQGKLVKQTKTDTPVAELLQKIQEEKERLVKEKKIKKDKFESYIYKKDTRWIEKIGDTEKDITNDIPFDIPDSWQWVRFKNIAEIYTGNSISEYDKINKFHKANIGYNFIATKDVTFDNKINYQTEVIIPYNELKFKTCDKGAILLCIEGGSAGRKVALVNKKICFGNKLCSFTPYNSSSEFLFYVLQSEYFKSIFTQNVSGLIGGVSISKINEFIFPLPPLEEQYRITQKLEEILSACERM